MPFESSRGMGSDDPRWAQIRRDYEVGGLSFQELANKYDLPRSTIWSKANRKSDPWQTPLPELKLGPAPRFDSPFPAPAAGVYDEKAKQFFAWIGKSKDFVASRDGKAKTENYLVITDVHIPYHQEEKLKQCVEDFLAEYGDGNLIIGGDYLDGYSLNAYGQMKESSLRHEMAVGRQWLEYFSSIFNKVWLIKDNHLHGRVMREIFKKLPPDVHSLIRHPYDVIVEGLPNVEHVHRTYKNGMKAGWFVVIGDALIAHAETHSAIPLRPVKNLSDWIDIWSKPLGLPDIRCVLEAHVHKLGSYVLPGKDRLIMETGCLVDWEGVEYSLSPDLKYKPIVNGCIHLIQENGVTDFNRTRLVHLG